MFRIGTHRTNRHKLGDLGAPGLVHQRHAHHQVIVEEFRRVLAIRPNAAHLGRQVNNDIGLGIRQQFLDRGKLG